MTATGALASPSTPRRAYGATTNSAPLAAAGFVRRSAWQHRHREDETVRSHHGSRQRAGLRAVSGEGRNRTGDTTVFSRVLYQLSYLAEGGQCSPAVRESTVDGGRRPEGGSSARRSG